MELEKFLSIIMVGLICLTLMFGIIGVTAVHLKKLDTEFYCNQQVKE